MQCFVDLNSGEAVEIGLENVAAKDIAHELALPPGLDQACILQLLHMVREGCRADWQGIANVSAGTGVAGSPNLLENLIATRIGQSAGNERELAVC